MKNQIEFETSKGMFLISEYENTFHFDMMCKSLWNAKLSEITEEQASEIVFRIGHHSNGHLIPSALELLHSLLKSKGIHLFENKAPLLHHTRLEQEQKTFYNPYIFKL